MMLKQVCEERDALVAQIHDMCHDMHVKGPVTAERFCDGCEQFQIKLFGKSPITKLRAAVELARSRERYKLEHCLEKPPKTEEELRQFNDYKIYDDALK